MTTTAERVRILVIDDDKWVRDLFLDVLDDRYHVEAYADPLTALDALREFRPEVVLLDYNMPEMNGLDALRRIKAILPATRVIMVTGMAEAHLAEDAFHLGAFAYLPKPFRIPHVEHLILTALQHHTR